MRGAICCLMLAILVGCSGKSGNGQEGASGFGSGSSILSTAQDEPTAADGRNALKSAMQLITLPMIRVGPVGTPKKCVQGNMNGQPVLSCGVCGSFLVAAPEARMPSDVYAARIEFAVPFKKAISYDQPDVAPVDGGAGVWVANYPPPSGNPFVPSPAPPNRILTKVNLDTSDFAGIGIGSTNGSNFYDLSDTGTIKILRFYRGNELIDRFDRAGAAQLVKLKAGSCGETQNSENTAPQAASTQMAERPPPRGKCAHLWTPEVADREKEQPIDPVINNLELRANGAMIWNEQSIDRDTLKVYLERSTAMSPMPYLKLISSGVSPAAREQVIGMLWDAGVCA